MNALVDQLQSMFPGYRAAATTRGTTALYLLLRAVRLSRGPGEVIVPAAVCPSVPLAVIYAGLKPRFCDVEPETFSLSGRTLRPCLSDKTRAIIVVYLFGKSVDISAVMEMRRQNDALVIIEDIALGIGGTENGRPLGSFGDCSILSFNDVKIVHGAGGALLVRDRELFRMIEESQHRLPAPLHPLESQELESSFHQLSHGLYDLMRSNNIASSTNIMARMARYYRRLFLVQKQFSQVEIDNLVKNLRGLPNQLMSRRKIYEIYQSCLRKSVNYVRFSPKEMCWRLPVLLDNHQQQVKLIETIRNRGLLISNHYFPVSHLFGDASPIFAREIGLRAVNLWVDEKAEPDQIPSICEEINATVG